MLLAPILDHEHHFDGCNKVGYVSSGKLKWQKNNVTICWFKTYLKWKRFNCHGRKLECKSNPGDSFDSRVRPQICKVWTSLGISHQHQSGLIWIPVHHRKKNQWSFGWHHGDERYDSIRSALVSLVIGPSTSENKQGWISSWWFQPLWKILVKMGNLPQVGVKTKNIWNHQPDMHTIVYRHICGSYIIIFKDAVNVRLHRLSCNCATLLSGIVIAWK